MNSLVVSKDQAQTDRDVYYSYDLDLIHTVLHNGSLVGLKNPRPQIEYSPGRDAATITRSTSETLTISTDHHDRSLMLVVCNPQIGDVYDEMTAIYLSRREVHALRTLLDNLAEV